MPLGERHKAKGFCKTSQKLISRIINIQTATYVQQSELSAISYRVYELRDPSTVTGSGTFNIASSIFNTLQTNSVVWPADSVGYNFTGIVGASAFPSKGIYIVEVKFVPNTGDAFYEAFELDLQHVSI